MFVTQLPRALSINYLRNFSSYSRVDKRKRNNNVGVKKRLAIFREENQDLDQLEIDEQALDEMESDLVSGSQMASAYRSELKKEMKKIELLKIERKYFDKIHLPNLLTWAEKEQIRDLHKSEPTLWTIDKLSQHFPATPDIIKKLLKNEWKPGSKERIMKHDYQVRKNWEYARSGQIQLDSDLKQHILSFTSRENIEQHNDDYDFVKLKMPEPARGSEFSRIITDYNQLTARLEEKQNPALKSIEDGSSDKIDGKYCHGPHYKITSDKIVSAMQKESSYNEVEENNFNKLIPFNKQDRKPVTLDELRERVINRTNLEDMSELDKEFLKGACNKTTNMVLDYPDDYETLPVGNLEKYSKVAVVETVEAQEAIPMKIKIPENTPKGSVFKVKDIYYDRDGRFLYRVPGMK